MLYPKIIATLTNKIEVGSVRNVGGVPYHSFKWNLSNEKLNVKTAAKNFSVL